jgi:hypothetical protein
MIFFLTSSLLKFTPGILDLSKALEMQAHKVNLLGIDSQSFSLSTDKICSNPLIGCLKENIYLVGHGHKKNCKILYDLIALCPLLQSFSWRIWSKESWLEEIEQ